ncbi:MULTISPECIES: ABC transporter ATP-binding protein [unclassified Candidatus Frackibacter]|uniref:ABC transporter ATP-binding protein n=1 Tax=unclassified Candidatus Frackibacter TaxID=2648818 RepID=UPI000884FF7B|nr:MULTISPECIES: ABC transporter ATP-binding protein [unclassified Candidatus Frackibacter]SDC17163.1 ATP-binding cassette, subfamily B, MsbA [Candidatus Frackibacter sp. WG11]SEM44584.1 ATP-binding cassette, subfamily B, MsbA [Candidatus Frackibacter sp. WG12]SFL47133.1 ATP-binding cassette, subfamily B, MsbA [Candidatus Frackibacter sp. WG13]
MEIFKRFFKEYLKPEKKGLAIAVIMMFFVAVISTVIPQMIRLVIDRIIPQKDFSLLNWVIIGSFFLLVIRNLLTLYRVKLVFVISQKVLLEIRKRLYSHLQHLSLSYYEQNLTGKIASRVTNDVKDLQRMIVAGSSRLIQQSLTIVGVIIFLFVMNWRLTLVTMSLFPIMLFITSKFGRKLRKVNKNIQQKMADMSGVLQEAISGMKIVKAFVNEEHELNKFMKEAVENKRLNIKRGSLYARLDTSINFTSRSSTLIILWYGGLQVMNQNLTVGELAAFITYTQMLFRPIIRLTMLNNIIQQGMSSLERIFEVLDTEVEVKEKSGAVELIDCQGEIIFEDVSFSYASEEEVLHNINLEVSPGEMVALVGPSGAGKTSIINLLLRFYNLDSGRIKIDGVDIEDYTLDSLRQQMGIVLQDPILFSGTIKENLIYGCPEASQEEIERAAKAANAHQFITNFPNGYETEIGEKGIKLSGGQKQRVAIAMALLKDPKILILDEATSSLDSESESLIQNALENLYLNRTTFVIAHRLSTIVKADKIVVIKEGKIKEVGNHKELLEEDGVYKELYDAQFKKETLYLDADQVS